MNDRHLYASVCLALASLAGSPMFASDRPNVIIVLTDDLGYGDLGCYGHPVAKTPRIDRLAREGVRFTQHYANGPECSPTRAALMTGRYQQRVVGLECAIGTGNIGRYDEAIRAADERQLGLSPQDAVLPRRLVERGYHCALLGKWHLGYEPQFNPAAHGWSNFFGYLGGNVHYFNHRELSDLHVLYQGRVPVHREGYMTHLITDQAVAFIQRQRSAPFFLVVSHECPHFPFQGPGDARKVINQDNWTTPDADTYVHMLQDLDAQVGRLMAAIDAAGIADRTLVMFVSDNGGFQGAAHMGPLRGAKSSTFEGGIRVPLIARWPGTIPAGQTSDQVCITFDLTRSILRLAGGNAEADRLDGYDIIDHVTGEKPSRTRTLFWRGRRGERTWWAVRDGDLKYVRRTEDQETNEWMFDLRVDRGETQDLLHSRSDDAQRLARRLQDWEADVDRHRSR